MVAAKGAVATDVISLALVVVSSLCLHSCFGQQTPAGVEAFERRTADLRDAAASAAAGGVRIHPELWNNLPDDGVSTAAKLEAIGSVWKGLQLFWTERLMQMAQYTNNSTSQQAASYDCTQEFSKLLNSSSGLKLIDSMGKPGSDILNGNVYWVGSFDECFEVGEDVVKYCLLPAALLEPLQIGFEIGICVPQSCNGRDIDHYVEEINSFIWTTFKKPYFLYANGSSTLCTDRKRLPFSIGAIVMIAICSLFAAMAVLGTLVDLAIRMVRNISSTEKLYTNPGINNRSDVSQSTEKTPLLRQTYSSTTGNTSSTPFKWEKPLEFIVAFSLFKNLSMILSTKQPPAAITSLNGIRVISMFWVILGHTYFWAALVDPRISNLTYVLTHLPQRFSFQAIINAYFSVDSFFFLSGVLVSYLTLREMERRKGWLRFPVITYYIHRYLRLTMVYAFCLFFWWFLTVHLSDGIGWTNGLGPGSQLDKSCSKYWWTNFLYINNFHPWKMGDECMGWTWYLANDMQFYVIAPIVLIPLFYFFPIGLANAGVLLLASFIANGWIAGDNEFSADLFHQNSNGTSETDQQDDIYIKPYCRIPPYLVGLVLGYVIHKKFRFGFRWYLNWILYLCLWVLASGCCFSALYGLYDAYRGHTDLSLAENVSYFMFSRFLWGIGLACVVFACHNGYGWIINDFLSMKIWIPLSRLTYTAYLIHPIVLTVMFGSMRDTFTYTDYIIIQYVIAAVVLSFGAAGVIATFVEFPLSNLEMAVFKLIGLKVRESTRRVEPERAIRTDSPLPQNSVESGYEAKVSLNSSHDNSN